MRVKDFMTANPVTITPDVDLRTALEVMAAIGRRLPVVQDGRLVGIITDRDLRLAMNSPYVLREGWQDTYLLESTLVENCMTRNPVTIDPNAALQEAAELMLNGRFSGLPVVDDKQQVIGIITMTDMLKALIHLLTIG